MLKYVIIKTDSDFDKFILSCKVLVQTPLFTEYRTLRKGIFLRIAKSCRSNSHLFAFIEPQINISRSEKDNSLCWKIQISIVPRYGDEYAKSFGVDKIAEQILDIKELFELIPMCVHFKNLMRNIVQQEFIEEEN